MKDDNTKNKVSRRDMLRGAGLSTALVGVASAAVNAKPAHSASITPNTRPVAGYHETDHVRKAYALARF